MQAKGFSYVQLLLVIGLLAVLAAVASPYYFNWQARQQVRTTSAMLWSDLHYVQSRAMQLEQAATWGVHIDNSVHQYVLFHGSTYSSSDPYNETITYSNGVTMTPSTDIVFAGLTGVVTSDVNITITSNTLTSESQTISINVEGLITQ